MLSSKIHGSGNREAFQDTTFLLPACSSSHPPPLPFARLLLAPLPGFPGTQGAMSALAPPLPSAQANDQRRGVIPILPDLRRERHHRFCAFLRRPSFLDDVHDLLVARRVGHAVADHDHERILGRPQLDVADLGFRGYAHAFARHVSERARVGQATETFLAEGVGHERGCIPAEAGRFAGVRWVVVRCQGFGFAGRDCAEEDACVAAMGGVEGAWCGRVPERSRARRGHQSDGGGGATFERGGLGRVVLVVIGTGGHV